MSRRLPLVLLLPVASAVALATGTSAAAAEAPVVRTVSVTARAAIRVPNDSARAGFSVKLERSSRGGARRATSTRLRSVIHAVKGVAGVGPGDVRTGRISVRKVSRGAADVYRARQGIGVTLHKAANAGTLVQTGIAAGATGVSGPFFFVGDREAASAKALAAAFDKAKDRAKVLATQAGGTLGPALEIDEGETGGMREVEFGSSKGVTEEASSAPSAAPPPTKPGTSKVTATVHVVFELL
jgi:uncharacterized protein